MTDTFLIALDNLHVMSCIVITHDEIFIVLRISTERVHVHMYHKCTYPVYVYVIEEFSLLPILTAISLFMKISFTVVTV